jgi:alpha-N-acetylglucosamine transferase
MLKTAIVTLCIGEFYEKMGEVTHPMFSAYADKIGADFIVLKEDKINREVNKNANENTDQKSPIFCYEKFQIGELLDMYDRVCFLDTDMIMHPDTPNIFDVVPIDMVGLVDETPLGYDTKFIEFLKENFPEYLNIWIEEKHRKCYNTGVLVCSQMHKSLFTVPEVLINHYQEQSYLNLQIIKEKVLVFELPYQYNRMIYMDLIIPEHRLKSYIVHYAGFLAGRGIEEVTQFLYTEYEMLISGDFSRDDVLIGWGTI